MTGFAIAGGTVVSPHVEATRVADVGIEDGAIVAVVRIVRAMASSSLGSHASASRSIAARMREVAAPYMPRGKTSAQ